MKLIGAWGNHNFRIGLLDDFDVTGSFILSTRPFDVANQAKVQVTAEEISGFLDCILDAIENSITAHTGQVISSVMETDEGFVFVGWRCSNDKKHELIVSQKDNTIGIPMAYLDECLSWLLKEFYLLGLKEYPQGDA